MKNKTQFIKTLGELNMKTPIKALVFDVYGTLFDVHSVERKCDAIYKGYGAEISQVWRRKQLEYSFLRQIMGQYESFKQVTLEDRKSTRLNSSHVAISYAVFCLKKKRKTEGMKDI